MRLSNKIKFLYGVGFVSVGIKDVLYTLFVFFFYNQVLGLDPFYTGLATFVSLFFDAFSDPFVGALSDNFRSKKMGTSSPIYVNVSHPIRDFNLVII